MIDVEAILNDLGIDYKNAGPANFKAKCFNPNHEEKKPSMMIHRETAVIHCFGCGLTGNVFTLLYYHGLTGTDALLYLQKFAQDGHTVEEIKSSIENFIKNRKPSSEVVEYENVTLPAHNLISKSIYLERRGITSEEIKKWNMASVTSHKNSGWILIPLYQGGVLRNYFLRSPFGDSKLYGDYSRNDLLAGIDFATDYEKPLYISEGIFDAIAVGRAGVQSVACLSNKLLPNQLKIVKKYKKVVIVPDNDSMGVKLVESAAPLIHSLNLRICTVPYTKKDAGACANEEIVTALRDELSYAAFMQTYILNMFF